MQLDASIHPTSLQEVPSIARRAEQLGFGAIWTSETQYNPFLPLPLVADCTESLLLGTSVAIGFARSPTDLAHIAWDLSRQSKGRFILGLGTQVKPHIERRFGGQWPSSPTTKFRELINAIRTVWETWQYGEKLNFQGEYYKLTLMSPFFNPGPIEHPDIPIHIAGVNRALCRLAGEIADGFHVHPLHTRRYLREIILPAIDSARGKYNRLQEPFSVVVSSFVVRDENEAEIIRSQIAFYASTPSYRNVMTLHGWQDVAEKLSGLARKGAWESMPALISDEMLDEFAVRSAAVDLPDMIQKKYADLADRVKLYQPFVPDQNEADWRRLCEEIGRK